MGGCCVFSLVGDVLGADSDEFASRAGAGKGGHIRPKRSVGTITEAAAISYPPLLGLKALHQATRFAQQFHWIQVDP